MEPVPGSTSGHMQLEYMKTIMNRLPVHAVVVDNLLLTLWTLTTTVSQELVLVDGNMVFSTLVTHCGMDKVVMDLRGHAVILQTSRGSAKSFLSQLLMTWKFASVGMRFSTMRILPLTLFNSTFSEL